MILKLIRWMFGYVIFSIDNKNSRLFLNLVSKSKLKLWDIENINNIMISKISLSDFDIILKLLKSNNVKLSLIKRIGLPYFLMRNKNRKGLLLGVLMFFTSLKILSNYVWKIDVQGIENINLDEIINISKENGVFIGANKKNIDSKITSQNIMSQMNDISWMSINIEGCTANILIKEREKEPNLDNNNSKYIRASCDARIVRMETFEGVPLVKAGDVVLKNQILVSSIFVDENGNEKITNAKANVWGEIYEEFVESDEISKVKKIRTGNVKTFLKFKNFKLNFWNNIDDSYNDVETYDNNIKFLWFTIPTGFSTEKAFETKNVEIYQTKDEILSNLRNKLDEKIQSANLEVISKEEEEIVTENKISLKIKVNYLKNISEYE